MNKILHELLPETRPNVLIGSIVGGIANPIHQLDANVFVANVDQSKNKEVIIKDNVMIFPDGEILPHIDYQFIIGSADDPNMIQTLGNAANILKVPLIILFDKPTEAYGSVRWVNMIKRCRSDLNVYTSQEIADSWRISGPMMIADYYNTSVMKHILTKVEEEYYK